MSEFIDKILRDLPSRLGLSFETAWSYFDREGYVSGVPTTVHLYIYVKDGDRYAVEFKYTLSEFDIYTFTRKCELYERISGSKVKKLIVAYSATDKARELASVYGVEVATP